MALVAFRGRPMGLCVMWQMREYCQSPGGLGGGTCVKRKRPAVLLHAWGEARGQMSDDPRATITLTLLSYFIRGLCLQVCSRQRGENQSLPPTLSRICPFRRRHYHAGLYSPDLIWRMKRADCGLLSVLSRPIGSVRVPWHSAIGQSRMSEKIGNICTGCFIRTDFPALSKSVKSEKSC